MKCPKCGYNSFEFLDACKKCGTALGSFKKSHRIGTVLLRSLAAFGDPQLKTPDKEVPQAVVLPPLESEPIPTVANSTVQSFQEPEIPAPQEKAFEGFDLDLPESDQEQTNELDFNSFSFSDELESPVADSTTSETLDEGFSFEEPAEAQQSGESWDFTIDEPGSGMENYERILEPDSIADIGGQFAEDISEETGSGEHFGTSNFTFAPESEDIFSEVEESASEPVAAKKAQPNLDDFEKEFDMIFDIDESTDTEQKTS